MTDAAHIPFAAGDQSDWTAIPRKVDKALDELAQRVTDREGDIRLVKDADETRTSTTTLADDDTLTGSVEANKHYILYAEIPVDCASATPDFKCTFTFPTGTGNINITGEWFQAAGTANWREGDVITADSDALIFAHAGAGQETARLGGSFDTGAAAGACNFQWAPRVNSGDNCTVLAGAILHLMRVD